MRRVEPPYGIETTSVGQYRAAEIGLGDIGVRQIGAGQIGAR